MLAYVRLHGWDLAQIYLTIGFAFAAFVNAARLTFTAPRRTRPLFAALTALAAFYVAAYVFLLTGPWPQSQWTKAIRGASLIVWGFVWTYLPSRLAYLYRKSNAKTAQMVPHAVETLVRTVKEEVES